MLHSANRRDRALENKLRSKIQKMERLLDHMMAQHEECRRVQELLEKIKLA
jgi:hypothetical protein